jgi:hypothetical protein
MRRLLVGLALALAFTAAPCFAFDDVFQQTYGLPAGGSLQLQNVNGSVEVRGWDRNEVEVRAVKSSRHNAQDLGRVRIDVDARPGSVSIETRYPQDEGVEVYVEYRIRVPRRVRLDRVTTVNGALRVFGVDATGDLHTVNGNIEVFESSGRLSARTTNGNVRMEMRQIEAGGAMSLETVNGSIVLGLDTRAAAELDVRSVNGDFRSELPIALQGSFDARQFHGRLGAGGGAVHIRTVNGAIRLVTLRPTI